VGEIEEGWDWHWDGKPLLDASFERVSRFAASGNKAVYIHVQLILSDVKSMAIVIHLVWNVEIYRPSPIGGASIVTSVFRAYFLD
jgi:hypothetical protein